MQIHTGEIWLKSRCLTHEKETVQLVYTKLAQQGYTPYTVASDTRSIWQRDKQKIIVSLVDDFCDLAPDRSVGTSFLFDHNTRVITDNLVLCPTAYKFNPLPRSFFGIYHYTPIRSWTPDKDFTFGVNRLDFKRMGVLLAISRQLGISNGLVNFNCEIRVAGQPVDPQEAFLELATQHSSSADLLDFNSLASQMPLKNYTMHHDDCCSGSWLNIIVETYSSDTTISFSEKIFRCLVTPSPWIAFAGRYAIARLRTLGFDVLNDIVDHSYDSLHEAQNKIEYFSKSAKSTISKLKSLPLDELHIRCQQAATHNQLVLADMKQRWPTERDNWLSTII